MTTSAARAEPRLIPARPAPLPASAPALTAVWAGLAAALAASATVHLLSFRGGSGLRWLAVVELLVALVAAAPGVLRVAGLRWDAPEAALKYLMPAFPLLLVADGAALLLVTGEPVAGAVPMALGLAATGAVSASARVTAAAAAGLLALCLAAATAVGAHPQWAAVAPGLIPALAAAAVVHATRREDEQARARSALRADAAEARSVLDPLTGLPNRQGLLLLADPMLQAARRGGDALHCTVVAVDGLRLVNETMGRQAGDDIIAATATALRGVIRGTDVVARWGGNELCVIGPGTGMSMLDVERRVRDALRADPPVEATAWEPKVTAGGAVLAPWDEGDLQSLLTKADLETYARRALRGTASRRRRVDKTL